MGIVAFSQTDFTDDLRKISVPPLVMHGDDDQIVPYEDSAPLTAKLVKNATLKTYGTASPVSNTCSRIMSVAHS
jgi:non-heme chloroperoxidase